MRLTFIKLVGFKSFVDPTVLSLPSNLSCIMGPNGSGKSNIIDAVRWVLGESAASRLRGDATTDVIFSGSTGRKPVGQASVELVFDNSDGTIGGEFAQFGEISVKRLVSRDGQSAYYLNGTHCRRRDITDLFLGTGLGARSYAIMEQGVITQIVESHPEQLRMHLEEAAGISKYKERRKETESRICDTRENLDRVRDVRDEVDKQLDRLNRQARAAERWKTLKAERARHEAELSALEYRALQADRARQGERLREIELSIERELASQRQAESDLESARIHQHAANENLNVTQGEVYKVGAEIARVEQQLAHHRELGERLQQEWVEAEKSLAELDLQSAEDRSQRQQLQYILEVGAPELEVLRKAEEAAQRALQEAENAQSQWQLRWDQYAQQAGEASRSIAVEQTRIEHTERESLSLVQRRQSLLEERQTIDLAALGTTGREIELALASQQADVERHEKEQSTIRKQLEVALEQEHSSQAQLDVLRQSQRDVRGRLSALEVLQQEALGKNNATARNWLEQHGLAGATRLAGMLHVQDGWE
ncbi:MAG TPA: chromosome segregation protein SMC, partial [Mizugakiibacter sp.]|nr:chromosome segregation protein SMC [Mizugakiibacter sp.]